MGNRPFDIMRLYSNFDKLRKRYDFQIKIKRKYLFHIKKLRKEGNRP